MGSIKYLNSSGENERNVIIYNRNFWVYHPLATKDATSAITKAIQTLFLLRYSVSLPVFIFVLVV